MDGEGVHEIVIAITKKPNKYEKKSNTHTKCNNHKFHISKSTTCAHIQKKTVIYKRIFLCLFYIFVAAAAAAIICISFIMNPFLNHHIHHFHLQTRAHDVYSAVTRRIIVSPSAFKFNAMNFIYHYYTCIILYFMRKRNRCVKNLNRSKPNRFFSSTGLIKI